MSPTQLSPTAAYDQPPPGVAPFGPLPGQAQPMYQGYGYPYPMIPAQLPKGMAITGMVLGIVGLLTALFYIGGVVGIIGLIFSIIGLRAANRGRAAGRGMAIAGLVTSILAIVVNAIEIVFVVWLLHTASHCSRYNPVDNPASGSQAQFNACVRQSIFGN
jgi:hypothetical protein